MTIIALKITVKVMIMIIFTKNDNKKSTKMIMMMRTKLVRKV